MMIVEFNRFLSSSKSVMAVRKKQKAPEDPGLLQCGSSFELDFLRETTFAGITQNHRQAKTHRDVSARFGCLG